MADMMSITVTTLDLNKAYEVIGPVCGSSLRQSDPDQGFLGAIREIRKSAALLQADAVIGLRQTAVPLSDGSGYFHVQLYGTAVREIEEETPDINSSPSAMAIHGALQNGRQEGDFLIDGSTLVRYIGQSEYVRIPDGIINIGAEAFHNARVVSVELPDSVTEIREGAFSGCPQKCFPELYFALRYSTPRQPSGDRQGGFLRLPRASRCLGFHPPKRSRGKGCRIPAQPPPGLETAGPLPVLRRILQGRPQRHQSLQYVRNGKRLLIGIRCRKTGFSR